MSYDFDISLIFKNNYNLYSVLIPFHTSMLSFLIAFNINFFDLGFRLKVRMISLSFDS